MHKVSIADIMDLSPAERIRLVEDIWDSLAESPQSVPLTDAQRKELDSRLEDHLDDPESGASWEEIKGRIVREP